MSDAPKQSRPEDPYVAFTAVLENLQHDFKAFGEALRSTREELGGQIAALDGRITGLDGRITGLDGRITGLDGRITGLEKEVKTLRADVHSLTKNFSIMNKTVDHIDHRLVSVEKKLMNGHAPKPVPPTRKRAKKK